MRECTKKDHFTEKHEQFPVGSKKIMNELSFLHFDTVIRRVEGDDDDEFRFNDASTHEGHLRQNGVLTWFCNEMALMISHTEWRDAGLGSLGCACDW